MSKTLIQYTEELLNSELDNVEIYKNIFGNQVSVDHARKCISTLERFIELSKSFQPEDGNENNRKTLEIHKDGSQTSEKLLQISEEQCKDEEFLLAAHGYDANSWQLTSAKNSIWTHGYSSRITVKPRSEYKWNPEDIQKLFNNLKTNYANKKDIIPSQHELNNNILVIPIADLHYNLVSDKFSTGNDYSIEIAEQVYYQVLNDVINRIKNKKFEKILFVVGNDFINADNVNGTTTKGTPQDNNGLWFSVVNKATQLIINGIDMLTHIAPVDVLYVPSNHDLHTMFGIMQTIKAWYRNDNNIFIDDSPLFRKYYRFGNTLLNFSHDLKVKEALKIISSEAKDQWSECTHIISMLAHLHQDMVYDKQGYLEVLRLPTISGWSRWTNNQGYIQSEKKNKSFIVNGDLGITDEINTVI